MSRLLNIGITLYGVVIINCVCLSCSKTPRLSDWELHAQKTFDCFAELAPYVCKYGTPINIQECRNKKYKIRLSPPCTTSASVYERLLTAGHKKLWALYRKNCHQGDYVCPEDPSEYTDYRKKFWNKHLTKGLVRLKALRKFEMRQPSGLFDAKWDATPKRVAEVIIENIKKNTKQKLFFKKEGVYSKWKDIHRIASGKIGWPYLIRTFYLEDKDGTMWVFQFEKKKFIDYSIWPSKKLGDIFNICREKYGTPTYRKQDSNGKDVELYWSGSKTSIVCTRKGKILVFKTLIRKKKRLKLKYPIIKK